MRKRVFFIFFSAFFMAQTMLAAAGTVGGSAKGAEAKAPPAVENKPVPAVDPVQAAASANPFPSGLLEISDYKYPVFLYAPPGYRPDSSYAMVIIAPSKGAKAEEGIKYLKDIADSKSVFVLSPHGRWAESGDVPYMLDEWLLRVKDDVMHRFPIDKKRIFIAGKESGANYAAYLGMKYAGDFAGAVLIGDAWAGPFAQLMRIQSAPSAQVPFFVALRTDQPEIKAKNEIWLQRLQEKGYPLRLVEVKSADEFYTREFKTGMFDWLEQTAQSWNATVAQDQKTFKAKLKKGVKDFFTV